MNAESNGIENDSDITNSIRLKYKGRRQGKNFNNGLVKSANKEVISQLEEKSTDRKEKIFKNEKENTNINLAVFLEDINSNTMKKITNIQGGDTGKPRNEITITKNEIKKSNGPSVVSKKFFTLNEDSGVNISQQNTEITIKRKIIENNINIEKNTRTFIKQINEESALKEKKNNTSKNRGSRINRIEKKEEETTTRVKPKNINNIVRKEEIIRNTINTTFSERMGNERKGRISQNSQIISKNNISKRLSDTNIRYTNRSKDKNQNKKLEEINLTEGLSPKDIRYLRNSMIDQFFSLQGHISLKQIYKKENKGLNHIQNQKTKDTKDETQKIFKEFNSYTEQKSRDQNKMQKREEINLIEGLNSRDITDLRMDLIDNFYTISGHNSRNHSQGKYNNQNIKIKKELNVNQKSYSREKSPNQKLKAKKDIYISQRTSSRKQSQNSNKQVRQIIKSNEINIINSGNSSIFASNKTIPIVNDKYVNKRESKTKKISQGGLSQSNKGQINVKVNIHNKRSNADRNTSSDKKTNEKSDKTKKIERNLIQVQKVLVTDTLNLKKRIDYKNSSQAYKPNYNTNTYIHKNNNNDIATKLAIKGIKSKEHNNNYSSMTNFYKNRDNISSITINETGKIQKKPYVLQERKIERIRSKSRMHIAYTNNMEEKGPVKNDFNHKLLIIKNISRNFKTISDIDDKEKLGHRYSYSSLTSSLTSNIGRKEIKEEGKKPKIKVIVSKRKNEVIKPIKKPFKLNYKNYFENNISTPENKNISKKIEIKSNIENKNKIKYIGEQEHNLERESSYKQNKINTRNIKNNNQNTYQKISKTNFNKNKILDNNSKIKIERIISELNTEDIGTNNKTTFTITKTEISGEKKYEDYNHLDTGKSSRVTLENMGTNYKINNSQIIKVSSNNIENKTETRKEQIISKENKNFRNKNRENDNTDAKIIKVKKNHISNNRNTNNARNESKINKENNLTLYKSRRKIN